MLIGPRKIGLSGKKSAFSFALATFGGPHKFQQLVSNVADLPDQDMTSCGIADEAGASDVLRGVLSAPERSEQINSVTMRRIASVVAVFALMLALFAAESYRRDIGAARARVASGSKIVSTPCGEQRSDCNYAGK